MNEYIKEVIQFIPLNEAKYPTIRIPEADEPLDYRIHAWHATSIDNWNSIKKKGLIPGMSVPHGQTRLGDFSGKGKFTIIRCFRIMKSKEVMMKTQDNPTEFHSTEVW